MNTQLMAMKVRHDGWMEQYARQQESGLSIKKWCRENGIHPNTFYNRLKVLRKEALESVDSCICDPALKKEPVENAEMTNFVRVGFAQQESTCSGIIVRTGNAEINILPDASAEHIKIVLGVLAHA